MDPYLFIFAQVAVGIVILLVVFFASLYVMRADSLVAQRNSGITNSNFDTVIIDGYIDSNSVAKKRFSTLNPLDKTFVPMPRSYNRMGGAQFSYTFWLFVGDSHPSAVANKPILLKGDHQKYTYRKTDASDDKILEVTEDVLIKCPLIRFGDTFKDIVLEFNTLDDINHQVNLSSVEQMTDTTLRHNLLSLIQSKWVYLSFVFEDNVPINDFENGIVIRFYINDIMYYTHRVSSTLRQNNGDFYLFPAGEANGCRIGDLKYYNHALGFSQIKQNHSAGPPKVRATVTQDTTGAPLYVSEYNKIDLYNL